MTLKDIVVHLDSTDTCRRRVQAALALALNHGAHLTGVGVLHQPYIPAYAEAQIGLDLMEQQVEQFREALTGIGAGFETMANEAGVNADWRIVEGDPVEVMSEQARYGDLTVLSQSAAGSEIIPSSHELPDRVILGAGRPVLVVPSIYDGSAFGNRIMVAWDASRMAARVVHDAMPLLKKADAVTIMVVNPEPGETGHGDLPGADLAAHLARHGVKAEADHTVSKDVGVGDLLLSRAADALSDMIVIGAYGHARWRELVLGGVTQHMLEHMPVPLLMSH